MPDKISSKDKYIDFCKNENSISIFCQPWWLDAVAKKSNWDVVLSYDKNNNVTGALPYYFTDRNKKIIGMPLLTQCLGPCIKYPDNIAYSTKLSFEKKTIYQLTSQLPEFSKFVQNLNYNTTNWLPFFWRGFKQTTRYTYIIRDISNPSNLLQAFGRKAKEKIKKASRVVKTEPTNDIELFYRINSMSYERQGKKPPYSFNFITRLDDACRSNNAREMLYAIDSKGNIHSIIYLVFDKLYIHLLMSGGDPQLRSSGAKSLLVWEAIQRFYKKSQNFNFEGSMVENIEAYNRSFNAEQVPYHQIYCIKSKTQKIIHFYKDLF